MDKKNDILDVPKIQKEIKKRHGEFVKEYASEIEKVSSDHRLFTDIIFAKLNRIALIFKEENVVDEVKMVDNGPLKELYLSKNGHKNYIRITTNGTDIIMRCWVESEREFVTDSMMVSEKVANVDKANFDWINFSKKLLDYIHANIYGRKEIVETRIEGMFKDVPRDTIRKSSKK